MSEKRNTSLLTSQHHIQQAEIAISEPLKTPIFKTKHKQSTQVSYSVSPFDFPTLFVHSNAINNDNLQQIKHTLNMLINTHFHRHFITWFNDVLLKQILNVILFYS